MFWDMVYMDTKIKNKCVSGVLACLSIISFITYMFYESEIFAIIGLLFLIDFVVQGLTWKIDQMEKEIKNLKR